MQSVSGSSGGSNVGDDNNNGGSADGGDSSSQSNTVVATSSNNKNHPISLEEQKKQQELIIQKELAKLSLQHEYQKQKITQKGIIAKQKLDKQRQEEEAKRFEDEAKAMKKMKGDKGSSSETNQNGQKDSEDNKNNSGNGKTNDKASATDQKSSSYVDIIKDGYQQLVNVIIRPPRAVYKVDEHLGPSEFTFYNDQKIKRTDFSVLNERGYTLQCSKWSLDTTTKTTTDKGDSNNEQRRPIVIYLHGNASCRLEAVPNLTFLLLTGCDIVSFDCCGSGLSDGEYVSLGYYEQHDLHCIITHIRSEEAQEEERDGVTTEKSGSTRSPRPIILWGRSMGATTSLMYFATYCSKRANSGDGETAADETDASTNENTISCMILDSPFASLEQVATELVEKAKQQHPNIMVPNMIISMILSMLHNSIQKAAMFDIYSLTPIESAKECTCPVLFIGGIKDDFIPPMSHAQQICEVYKCSSRYKNFLLVPGDHNDERPIIAFDAIYSFLQHHVTNGGIGGSLLQSNSESSENNEKNRNDSFSSILPLSTITHIRKPPWYRYHTKKTLFETSSATGSSATSNSDGDDDDDEEAEDEMGYYDANNIGMTKQRQKEIQSSVVQLLSQQQEEEEQDDD